MVAPGRRSVLAFLACIVVPARGWAAPGPRHAMFVNAAFRMKARAVETGDQPYGAVVAYNGDIIGWGPSRVVIDRDATAHAERVAIREAQVALNRKDLSHCILYSTSRPCADCERAAAQAGIARMYFGEDATDAGAPR